MGWLSNLLPSVIIGLIVGGAAGWQLDRTIEGHLDKAILASETERQRLINDISTASAEALEGRLLALHENEVVVEKHFTTEIIKPVFTHVCATDEYVRLFNESSEAAERALSGKHDAGVPGKSPPPDGKNGQ